MWDLRNGEHALNASVDGPVGSVEVDTDVTRRRKAPQHAT